MHRSFLQLLVASTAACIASTSLAQSSNCSIAPVVTAGSTPFNCTAANPSVPLSGASTTTLFSAGYFTFTPAASCNYTISLCGSVGDTQLAIGYFCPTNLFFAVNAYNDDACACTSGCNGTYASRLDNLSLSAGITYRIIIGAYTAGETVSGTMVISTDGGAGSCAADLAGSVGSNAIPMDCFPLPLDLTGYCNPGPAGDDRVYNPHYFSFVAPFSGTYGVSTCAQPNDARLAVLGTCGDGSTAIACNDDQSGLSGCPYLASALRFHANAGQAVSIAVGSYLQDTPLPPTMIVDISQACRGDIDGNGIVDGADLGRLLGSWGTQSNDLDGDGIVNGSDLGILLGGWGVCPW